MSDRIHYEHWRGIAEEAARQGGAEVRARFGRGLNGTEKRGTDLVTEADLESERCIIRLLREAEPSFGIVSEEAGEENASAEYVWLVDPLDGTSNFVIDLPYVGVAVTLLCHGVPIVAATHNPLLGTIWSAAEGAGVWRDGVPIRVNPTRLPERAVVAWIQGYPVPPEQGERLCGAVGKVVKRVLGNWAPALDWCLLASGGIDALVSLDSESEDQLGGALIAREAGALLTDFSGQPTNPTAPRLLAAASEVVQGHILGVLPKG